jgi:hypothetical protein
VSAPRDSVNSGLNEFGSYTLADNDCATWAKAMLHGQGLIWPLEAAFVNLGAGVGGPIAVPAAALTRGLAIVGEARRNSGILREAWMTQNTIGPASSNRGWVDTYNATMTKISTTPVR